MYAMNPLVRSIQNASIKWGGGGSRVTDDMGAVGETLLRQWILVRLEPQSAGVIRLILHSEDFPHVIRPHKSTPCGLVHATLGVQRPRLTGEHQQEEQRV